MKYTITYSCGHEGEVELFGKTSMREYIISRKSEEICPDCQAAERAKENEKSSAASKDLGLPQLTGSEKQVAWAETIRLKIINAVDEALQKASDYRVSKPVSEWDTAQDIGKKNIENWHGIFGDFVNDSPRGTSMVFAHMIASKTNASFWIDNRNASLSLLLTDYARDNMKAIIDYYTVPEETKEENESCIIKPETINKSGVAEIKVDAENRKISAAYEKDDAFREIVKSHHMSWDAECSAWVRKPSKLFAGDIIDRAAEIAVDLLRAGFAVKVEDAVVRAKISSSDPIAPEQRNWISRDAVTGNIIISHDKSDKLYNLSRGLPGAWYNRESGKVNIKPKHYLEIRDFARLYNFSISPGAEEELSKAEDELTKAVTVNPPDVVRQLSADALEAILKSDDDVIPDLKDE